MEAMKSEGFHGVPYETTVAELLPKLEGMQIQSAVIRFRQGAFVIIEREDVAMNLHNERWGESVV